MMEKIGDRIKHRRELLQMSQDDLAKKLGYKSRSSINKIERDASGLPQSKIAAIAKALDTTPSYIMGWIEATPAETKKSNTIADITDRMFKDSDFMDVVMFLNDLDHKQIGRAKELLQLIFKEGLNENK